MDWPPLMKTLQGNVLVSDTGQARLSDFGFSSLLMTESASFSEHSSVKGTIRWMAPELLFVDPPPFTTHSDMWAVGCLIFEV